MLLEIEVTNHCNIRCLHCPREAITRPLGMMSWEVFEAVVDKTLAHPGVESVNFSGLGEPTLNPLLPRFISAFSPRISTFLTTNASTLSPGKIQELVDAGLENVIVSFNGHDAETFGLMTGGLSLKKIDERVRDLIYLGEGKIRVLANVSVTRQTKSYLPEIKSHINNLGVQEMIFSQCHSRGGYLQTPLVCETPMPPLGNERCDILANILFVAWNGEVLSCCHDLRGEGRIGNLVTENMDEVLERKQHIVKKEVQFSMCKNCNDMYRFSQDPTPDGTPLTEWIYSLYASEDTKTAKLVGIIRQQEVRIRELEQLVAAYERGRLIRFMRRVRETLSILRGTFRKRGPT